MLRTTDTAPTHPLALHEMRTPPAQVATVRRWLRQWDVRTRQTAHKVCAFALGRPVQDIWQRVIARPLRGARVTPAPWATEWECEVPGISAHGYWRPCAERMHQPPAQARRARNWFAGRRAGHVSHKTLPAAVLHDGHQLNERHPDPGA